MRLGSLACLVVILWCAKAEVAALPKPSLAFIERTLGGAEAHEKLPMLVVMHGLGDTPEHFARAFDDVSTKARLVALRAPDPWGEGSSWYDIEAAAGAKGRQIQERAELVAECITRLSRARPTRGKAVVSGFSQGGVLSYALASYHADKLFAAVPIAGSLPVGMAAPRKPPVWFSVLAFHGENDKRIPLSDGERTFELLEQAGFKGAFSKYPGLGHGISESMHVQLTAALNELLERSGSSK